MSQHPEDLRLVQRAIARDPDAIDALGERFSCIPGLVGAASRRLGAPLNRDQQADLVQDVILILWQKLETFEGRSTLEGWAWSYVHFQTKNQIRRAARLRRERQLEAEIETLSPMPAPEPDIFDHEVLNQVIESLPPEMAETIKLKHFEGLKFREIAAKQDVSENTAKTRYYRGLTRARKALSQLDERGTTND